MNGEITNIVLDADLRCSHAGLTEMAKTDLKIDVRDLKIGEFVFFLNHSWTQVKAIGAQGKVVLHYKNGDNSRLNPKAVLRLPRFIRGQDIGYKEALTEVIEAEYSHRYPIASKREQ